MPEWHGIFADLARSGCVVDDSYRPTPVGGGDISAAWRVDGVDGPFFLKTGSPDRREMFAAEADGLAEIAASKTLRVPRVLATGCAPSASWLALEWLDLERGSADTDRRLGTGLAAMHRTTASAHGWHRDNTIGATPQRNEPCENWCEFYREYRLRPQFEMAGRNGFNGALQMKGEAMMAGLDAVFGGHSPAPSLLHGDLWGGNHAVSGGMPVLFDPAVYYGDRETDLAMIRLFGGFSTTFYDAYEAAWPLPPGHEIRTGVYQLYHVLNHLNLFGTSYLASALRLIDRALDVVS